jgi:hypothetical protein
MTDQEMMAAILDSFKDPVLFTDTDHIVRYYEQGSGVLLQRR